MPYADGTLTDDDVAAELGVPPDDRVTFATDAARSWGEAYVPSLAPAVLWSDPVRHRGGVLEGCFQYLRRAAPDGMPAYEGQPSDVWTLHLDAERCLRPDAVVA